MQQTLLYGQFYFTNLMLLSSQALGLDDTRLIVPIILIPVIIGIIFQGFAAEQVAETLSFVSVGVRQRLTSFMQDNTDFFDTYDQRRK